MSSNVTKCSLNYDYIVVGGGAAGSIVASRLSACKSVLLLESGNNVSWTNPIISDPKNWTSVSQIPDLEWGYESVPQQHMNDRIIATPRAKVLGGCQVHNAMVYVRGGKNGFDAWENEEGCVGWNYDSIVPYFERVEKEMSITVAEKIPFINDMIEACKEFDIPYNSNYNDPRNGEFGISSFQFLIDSEKELLQRQTTFHTYIRKAHITNLTVRGDILVSQVLIDKKNKCYGVRFYDTMFGSQVEYEVHSNNDVILCAGAFGTPQILMLSGIGDGEHLKSIGIEVVSDLPGVGQNLQDDVYVTAGFKSKQYVDPQPYGLLGAVIFWPSFLSPKNDSPNIPTNVEASMASGAMIGMGNDTEPQEAPSYWIWPNIQRLSSRGTVQLQSKSIFDCPLIDPNYFANSEDVTRAVCALKLAIKIGSASAMSSWFDSQLEPPPNSTDEQLVEYVKRTAGTCHHFAGTAKMGPQTDPMAVVSPETLMVYGVTGLRVADASIIPTTVSGNTQGATMMIGEKASDIILTLNK